MGKGGHLGSNVNTSRLNNHVNLDSDLARWTIPCLTWTVFNSDRFGSPSTFPHNVPGTTFRDDQVEWWLDTLDIVSEGNQVKVENILLTLFRLYNDPIRLINWYDLELPSPDYSWKRFLAHRLFGPEPTYWKDDDRSGTQTWVQDCHVHSGLAYDVRTLLNSIIYRGPSFQVGSSSSQEMVVLLSSIRWAFLSLSDIVRFRSWELPDFVHHSNSAGAWSLVVNGKFWTIVSGIVSKDSNIGRSEIQTIFNDVVSFEDFERLAHLDTNGTSQDTPHRLLKDVFEQRLLNEDQSYHITIDNNEFDWRHVFILNLVRACVRVFSKVASIPGEGFAEFQSHCDYASQLRKSIVGPQPGIFNLRKDYTNEVLALRSSMELALVGFPRPFRCNGFELRREIDPCLTTTEMERDILSGFKKLWSAFDGLLYNLPDDFNFPNGFSFSTPISFQRPRVDWTSSLCPGNHATDSDIPVHDLRYSLPWEQVSYAATLCSSIASLHEKLGSEKLRCYVGWFDVSGAEVDHASWPYVAAMNWLYKNGIKVPFGAHAGECFRHGYRGLRTIGEFLVYGSENLSRLGHCIALGMNYRRKVSNQYPIVSPLGYAAAFTETMLDLCFFHEILRELEDTGGSTQCANYIERLARPYCGSAIPVDSWIAAFKFLHSYDLIDWAIENLGLQGDQWCRESSKSAWRATIKNCVESTQHAIQCFAWNEVISTSTFGRTPEFVFRFDAHLYGEIEKFLMQHTLKVDGFLRSELAKRKVVVECCPTSNMAIAGTREYSSHPLWELRHTRDLHFTVSSDDPLVFGGFAGRELRTLLDHCPEGASFLQAVFQITYASSDTHQRWQPATDLPAIRAMIKDLSALLER